MKKKSLYLIFFFLYLFLSSCKKDVPTDKLSFTGHWMSEDGTTQITIDPDGHGFYTYTYPGMGYFKDERINGRVKFTNNGFVIKTLVKRKDFTVSKYPTKLPPSSSYISAAYLAIFNDQKYYK